MAPQKSASAFERRGMVYLHPLSRTKSWIYMATPPFLAVARLDTERIAEAVRKVLAASRPLIDEPPDDVMDALYTMAGVRTWTAFVRGTRLLSLEQNGGVIELIPCRNGGGREGFQSIEGRAIKVPEASDALGAVVGAALDACE
jgi:hypothetical protein